MLENFMEIYSRVGGERGIRRGHIPSESTVFIGLSEKLPNKMSK